MDKAELKVGDILQIDPHVNSGPRGCLLIVTKPKSWGAQGYVAVPDGDGTKETYYRVKFADCERVGRALWVAQDESIVAWCPRGPV